MAQQPVSRRDALAAYRAATKAGSLAAGARALKMNRCTFTNRVRVAVELYGQEPIVFAPRPAAAPRDPAPLTEAEHRTIRRLRAEMTTLRGALTSAEQQRDEAEKFRAITRELHDRQAALPDWPLRVPAHDAGPGVPMLFLSDWHVGETVDPAQVHGANGFDREAAERRVKQVLDRALHICFHHVKTPEYPGIVVILGGDFVSGWLHEELFRTDWCSPIEAASWCSQRIHRLVLRLAEAFGRVHLVCVPGNHGRLTKKPMAKGGATSCFDHAIYLDIADRLAGDARVTLDVPASGDALVQVAGTRYMIMHGHELGVKGGDGLIGALGPIMRGAIKTGRAERSLGRDFDVLLLAHFHQAIWAPANGVIVNGTLKGYDEYARKQRYSYAPATQWLWFSHPLHGPNIPHDLRLDAPRSREPVAFVAVEGRADA